MNILLLLQYSILPYPDHRKDSFFEIFGPLSIVNFYLKLEIKVLLSGPEGTDNGEDWSEKDGIKDLIEWILDQKNTPVLHTDAV